MRECSPFVSGIDNRNIWKYPRKLSVRLGEPLGEVAGVTCCYRCCCAPVTSLPLSLGLASASVPHDLKKRLGHTGMVEV